MTIAKLKSLSKKYPNKWVALQHKTGSVVGVGTTPKEAFTKSIAKGVKEPVITKIPKDYGSYVLAQI